MATGVTQRVSLSATGAQGVHDAANESVSAGWYLVAFRSGFTEDGSDFQVYVRNIAAGTTTMASVSSGGTPQNGGLLNPNPISDDGTHVAFQTSATNLGVTDGNDNVYVRYGSSTDLVSRNNDGDPANGDSAIDAVSPDGRFVAFSSGDAKHRARRAGRRIPVRHDIARSSPEPDARLGRGPLRRDL